MRLLAKIFFLYVLTLANCLFGQDESSFTIRPAKSGEEGILYNLIRELAIFEGASPDSISLSVDNLKKYGFSKDPFFSVEVADMGGEIIGYALYFYTFSSNQGFPVLYLDDLYVKAGYRGLGIGSQLLKKLALYAQQANCCRLEWHVYDWNKSAINFYENIGGELKRNLILVRIEKNNFSKLADN